MLKPIISDDVARLVKKIEALEITLKDANLPVKDRDIFENTLVQLKAHKAELERRQGDAKERHIKK